MEKVTMSIIVCGAGAGAVTAGRAKKSGFLGVHRLPYVALFHDKSCFAVSFESAIAAHGDGV